jgi:DNA-binding transcriptional ArsR family regulator
LNFKRPAIAVSALILAAAIMGCFVVQLYWQQTFSYTYNEDRGHHLEVSSIQGVNAVSINQYILLGTTPQLSVQTITPSQSYLANVTRSQIFEYINQNPGVQFRAVASALCLPVGLAEYHLGVLVRAGLVSFVRDGRYKRFFVSKQFSKSEMTLICLLRHGTAKRIFKVLLGKKELSHCKLAEEVDITSQGLTWQMKTLKNTKYLLQVNDGAKTVYSLNQSATTTLCWGLAVVEQQTF